MPEAIPDLSRLRIERGPSGAAAGGGRAGWLVAALVALAFLGYAAWQEGWLPGGAKPAGAGGARRVEVAQVSAGRGAPAQAGVAANGYVVARRRAALSTDIQGRIVEITVEEGDRVEAGQLVARLDTRQLEASLASARAELSQQQVLLEVARRDFQRFDALLASGDATASERDAAWSQMESIQALTVALAARIDEIGVMIDKSSVFAPFSGVVTAKNAEVGEVVAALGTSGPTAKGSVATLVDFETLEVQVELAQTSLGAAREGAPATIILDAWQDRPYAGQVRQIWPTANRTKATVEVRVVFLERDESILPEMGVRVVFGEDGAPAADEDPAVRVPQRALLGATGAWAVLLVRDGRVERRAIELAGEPSGGSAVVAAGLSGGETVVLDPDPGLADGSPVTVGAPQ